MRDINRGKLCVLKDLLRDPDTRVAQRAAANIIGEVLTDEDFDLYDLSDLPAPADKSAGASGSDDEIIRYGREVIEQGAGLIGAIRLIREYFGMSQRKFADFIGLSQTTVSRAETGEEERRCLLARMAEMFGTDGGAAESEA